MSRLFMRFTLSACVRLVLRRKPVSWLTVGHLRSAGRDHRLRLDGFRRRPTGIPPEFRRRLSYGLPRRCEDRSHVSCSMPPECETPGDNPSRLLHALPLPGIGVHLKWPRCESAINCRSGYRTLAPGRLGVSGGSGDRGARPGTTHLIPGDESAQTVDASRPGDRATALRGRLSNRGEVPSAPYRRLVQGSRTREREATPQARRGRRRVGSRHSAAIECGCNWCLLLRSRRHVEMVSDEAGACLASGPRRAS